MFRLSLDLLGPFQASFNQRPLTTFRTRYVQALLIFLAVEHNPRGIWRQALMTMLWPGKPQDSAQHNLRQTIYLLRRALALETHYQEGHEILQTERHYLNFGAAVECRVDVTLFENLMAQCQNHDHASMLACRSCHDRLEQVVMLYRGDFLADFFLTASGEYECWASEKRQELRRLALDALECLSVIQLERGDYRQARRFARRQLSMDSLRERAYQQLMTALARDGRRHEALAVYEDCQMVLSTELGMAPAEETTIMRDEIAAGAHI